jgi:hypothetical protein
MNQHVEVMAGDSWNGLKGRPSGEAAVRGGRIRRLIIGVPPRHLKSKILWGKGRNALAAAHLASVAFPPWSLGHEPSI